MDNLTPGERPALLKEKKGGFKEAQAEMISPHILCMTMTAI